jgi:hypothetical protein
VKRIRMMLMVVAASALSSGSGLAQSLNAGSLWTNQSGSTLQIDAVAADGSFTGTYVDHAADVACRNTPFRASGWIDGEQIAFSVRWINATVNCQSITSWTGYIGPKGLLMQWVRAHHPHGRPSIATGKDTFH